MVDDSNKNDNVNAETDLSTPDSPPVPGRALETIAEGRVAEGQTLSPVHPPRTLPVPHPQSRRHSRSESLVQDMLDVLVTIDEVEAEPVGSSIHGGSSFPVQTADTYAAIPATPDTVGSNRSGLRQRRGHGRGHSRAQSLTDGLLEEVIDVAEAFVDELNAADDGETFFLDMSLARGISIIPDDVVRVAEATAPEIVVEDETTETTTIDAEKQHLLLPKIDHEEIVMPPPPPPVSAYFLLATAVIALSSIGPLLNLQTGVNPILKIFWRMFATAMILSPLAAFSVYNEGLPKGIELRHKIMLVVTAGCYATMCVSFVLSLQYTSVGNAVILGNSQAILLLLGKLFVGQRILPMEASGAILAFAGAALCSRDSADRDDGGAQPDSSNRYSTLFGDCLALLSATSGVFYLTFAKTVRPHIALYQFMFMVMFCGSMLILIFLFTFTHIELTVDRNVQTGIWGWMNLQPDRLPLELTMVILCNLFGAMGYVRSMQFFSNLVISVAALLEPVIAELTAAALGVDQLPGTTGWIGNAMVAFGTFAVVFPSASGGKGGGGH